MALVVTEYQHINTLDNSILFSTYQNDEIMTREGTGNNDAILQLEGKTTQMLYRWSTSTNSWQSVN